MHTLDGFMEDGYTNFKVDFVHSSAPSWATIIPTGASIMSVGKTHDGGYGQGWGLYYKPSNE